MADKKPDPAPASAASDPAAAPAPSGGALKAALPALLAIVLAPAATFGVAHFVLLPRFEAGLQAALADPAAAGAKPLSPAPAKTSGSTGAKSGAGAKVAEGNTYRFENIVVNLAGTMGTRYLKVAFLVGGERGDVVSRFDAARPQLGDVTLAVLSSLSLADLEEPGSKNIIRERLLAAYNQALGARVVDSLYFSEFVVQ